jgi:HK97 family phage major capsid protein
MADLLETLEARRAALFDKFDGIAARGAEAGGLSDEDAVEFDQLKDELDELDERIAGVKKVAEQRAVAAAAAASAGAASGVQVVSEPGVYTPESNRRDGVSFFRDVAQRTADPDAADRLLRHQRGAGVQARDVGTGAFAGLTVPQYLTELVAPLRRAGAPTLNLTNKHTLPGDGMTVNISRITTGTGTAAQATENAAVQETNMDDTLLTVNVRTYAGMQDVSRQAIDRSVGVDDIIIEDLTRAYLTTVNSAIINADGTSGTHLGIRSTSNIVSVTYTDASPTAAELYPKLFDLIQQIQSGVFMGIDYFLMHPRRFWWTASQVGTTFPFLQFFSNAPQVGGSVESVGYEGGASGNIGGIPVVVDANIPTNLGGGTEDLILGVTSSELHFWEDPGAPLFIRTDQAVADQLTVRFVLYGYSAFTAGRYPGAHGTIGGTGLIAPTF